MSISEKALEKHASGCNCAQSVLCACGDYTQLNEDTARQIAAGFGAGMRCGEVCGAVSGAVMAVGAACGGSGKPGGSVASVTRQLTGAFKEKYGCIRCADLLRDAGQRRCPEFIAYCAELAEQLILDQQS